MIILDDGTLIPQKNDITLNDLICSTNPLRIKSIEWSDEYVTNVDRIFDCENLETLVILSKTLSIFKVLDDSHDQPPNDKIFPPRQLSKLKNLILVTEYCNEFCYFVNYFPNLEIYINTSSDNSFFNLDTKIQLTNNPKLKVVVLDNSNPIYIQDILDDNEFTERYNSEDEKFDVHSKSYIHNILEEI